MHQILSLTPARPRRRGRVFGGVVLARPGFDEACEAPPRRLAPAPLRWLRGRRATSVAARGLSVTLHIRGDDQGDGDRRGNAAATPRRSAEETRRDASRRSVRPTARVSLLSSAPCLVEGATNFRGGARLASPARIFWARPAIAFLVASGCWMPQRSEISYFALSCFVASCPNAKRASSQMPSSSCIMSMHASQSPRVGSACRAPPRARTRDFGHYRPENDRNEIARAGFSLLITTGSRPAALQMVSKTPEIWPAEMRLPFSVVGIWIG